MPTVHDLPAVDELAREAAARGADYVSMRRLAELLGSTSLDTFAELTQLLSTERPISTQSVPIEFASKLRKSRL